MGQGCGLKRFRNTIATMAKARMLHGKISLSAQVNRLSLPARLLFTWMIAHADDEGRLKGDPECVKATVVPMTNWSSQKVRAYTEEIKNVGLIHYWQINQDWFIEFIKWRDYQQIKSDRFKPSKLPSFSNEDGDKMVPNETQDVSKMEAQSNAIESSEVEVNKGEFKDNTEQPFVGNDTNGKRFTQVINPKTFEPTSDLELAAKEIWERLESYNLIAFQTTYLWAVKQGVPVARMYEFASEIEQNAVNIRSRGAVFRTKVKDYLASKTHNP